MMNSSQTQQLHDRIKYLKERVKELEDKIEYYEEHPEELYEQKIIRKYRKYVQREYHPSDSWNSMNYK